MVCGILVVVVLFQAQDQIDISSTRYAHDADLSAGCSPKMKGIPRVSGTMVFVQPQWMCSRVQSVFRVFWWSSLALWTSTL